MKTKQFEKRLLLHKETISNLEDSQMNEVLGGVYTDYCTEVKPATCGYQTRENTICRTACVTRCTSCF